MGESEGGAAAGFDGEAFLATLDPIGWRFGLERIEALMELLGQPQRSYETVHVVGTNGKTSVTEMCAALLEAHGVRSGAYLSPHLNRWSERVRVGGAELSPAAFDRSLERVAAAIAELEPRLDPDDHITQFEASTAGAFVGLAQAEVECGVIEAGLGGRLDATNVLDSTVTVLTSVGLDHTQWLGDTELEIAAEKLAVLREGTTLILGDVSSEVETLARKIASARGAEVRGPASISDSVALANPAPFLRRDFGAALAAAEVVLGTLDPAAVATSAKELAFPGRLEQIGDDPPLFADAAHNEQGAAALAEALGLMSEAHGGPVVACLAILSDKDAAAIVRALAPALAVAVCTELPADALHGSGRPDASWFPAAELGRFCEAAGIGEVEVISDPADAIARSVDLARELGGVALAAGSHYLLRQA